MQCDGMGDTDERRWVRAPGYGSGRCGLVDLGTGHRLTESEQPLILHRAPPTYKMPHMTLCKFVLAQINRPDPVRRQQLGDLLDLFGSCFGGRS
jgi:hypothetical protein